MTACVIFSPSFASASALQLRQDHRGNFRRRKRLVLAADFDFDVRVAIGGLHDLVRHALLLFVHLIELAAHEALDRKNGVLRIGDGLALGGLADETLAGLGERDDGRRRACAFGVFENYRFAALHDGHAGVGGAQIDT